MIVVSTEKHDQLLECFPKIETLFDPDTIDPLYKTGFISGFDHWLSEAEAENLDITKHFSKHQAFYETLFQMGEIYVLSGDESGYAFFEFENIAEFRNQITESIEESEFLVLCLPTFQAVYWGNYDSTNALYYRDDAAIQKLLDMANTAGLYFLE